MRDIKTLLEIVLNAIKDAIDGECIVIHQFDSTAFCLLTGELQSSEQITEDEEDAIDIFLDKMIKSDLSANYPVTFRHSPYGSQDSLYYFRQCNWSIRRQWLQEIINTL